VDVTIKYSYAFSYVRLCGGSKRLTVMYSSYIRAITTQLAKNIKSVVISLEAFEAVIKVVE